MEKLSQQLQSKIRSTVHIIDFKSCVYELILNSIDSKSSNIDVFVDFNGEGTIEVKDDGISMSDQQLLFCGRRYFTSKCSSEDDLDVTKNPFYGFRGEALSSMANLCEYLSIRCYNSGHKIVKVMKAGEEIDYSTYPDFQAQNRSYKTCIKLENIFYKMPVRQRNLDPLIESDCLNKLVTSFALLNHNITFSLLTSVHPMIYFPKSPSSLVSCKTLYGPLIKNCLVEIHIPNNLKHRTEQKALNNKSELHSKKANNSVKAINYIKPQILKNNFCKMKGYVGVIKTSALNFNILYFNNKPIESNNDLKTYIKNEFKRLKKFIEKKNSEMNGSKCFDYELLYMLNLKVKCKKYQTIACFHTDACALVDELMCHVKKIIIEDIFKNNFHEDINEACDNDSFNLNKLEGMQKAAEKLMKIVEEEELSLNKKTDTSEIDENVLKDKPFSTNLELVSKADTNSYTTLKNNKAKTSNSNTHPTTNVMEEGSTHVKSKRSDVLDYNEFYVDDAQYNIQASLFKKKMKNIFNLSPSISKTIDKHFKTPYHISDFSQLVDKKNLQQKVEVFQNKNHTCQPILKPAKFIFGNLNKTTLCVNENATTLTNTTSAKCPMSYSFLALSPMLNFSAFKDFSIPQKISVSLHQRNLSNQADFQAVIREPTIQQSQLEKHNTSKINSYAQNEQKHKNHALMQMKVDNPPNVVALMRKRSHVSNHCHNIDYFIKKHRLVDQLNVENLHHNLTQQKQNASKTIDVTTLHNDRAQKNFSSNMTNLGRAKTRESLKENLDKVANRRDVRKSGKVEGKVQKMMDRMLLQQPGRMKGLMLSKETFKYMRVIGQVNKNFIACTAHIEGDSMLLLVDQHASHERVRLERLITDIKSELLDKSTSDVSVEKKPAKSFLKNKRLDNPIKLELPLETIKNINLHRSKFHKYGLEIVSDNEHQQPLNDVYLSRQPNNAHITNINSAKNPSNSTTNALSNTTTNSNETRHHNTIPTHIYTATITVLAVPECMRTDNLHQSILELITEVLEAPHGTDQIPSSIHNILCSEACHGAIKFGDELSMTQMCRLIDDLSKCKLPFQCAHGRPSIAPLTSISALNSQSPNELCAWLYG